LLSAPPNEKGSDLLWTITRSGVVISGEKLYCNFFEVPF
jgi:hypothetical protein